MTGGNHLRAFIEWILHLRGLAGSNRDCPEERNRKSSRSYLHQI
jgi:hypothetical protein